MDTDGDTFNRNRMSTRKTPTFLKLTGLKLFKAFKWILFHFGFSMIVVLGLFYQQRYFKELYRLALKGGRKMYS